MGSRNRNRRAQDRPGALGGRNVGYGTMPDSTHSVGNAHSPDEASTGGREAWRFDVLCQRAERLIDSVRMAHQQVDAMFSRPERIIADANATAQALIGIDETLGSKLDAGQHMNEACEDQLVLLHRTLTQTQQATEGLVPRVQRARQLADAFAKLMDGVAERTEHLQSAGSEAQKTRDMVQTTLAELKGIQATVEQQNRHQRDWEAQQQEWIDAGRSTVVELRSATEVAGRLMRGFQESVASLEAILEQSRQERQAWQRFFARLPRKAGKVEAAMVDERRVDAARSRAVASKSSRVSSRSATESSADVLAERIRKLGSLVREIGSEGVPVGSTDASTADGTAQAVSRMAAAAIDKR